MALSCVFAGIGISRVHAAGNTEPTTVAAEDFKVSHIGVRFAEADKTEHGLRFKVAISKSKLDALKADANVSKIAFKFSVAPQYLLKGVYVADAADALTYDIADADWKVVTDGGAEYYEAAVYVSEIPQQAKFLQLAAQCVLTYTETIVIKDTANTSHDVPVPRTFCTAVQYASMADVAQYAKDNNLADADKVAAYLPGNSVITYVSDGKTVSTETATYGAKLDLPALTLNDGEYVVWKTANGKVWNKDFTAQGNITLTAEKGVYFGKVFEESAYRTATKVTDVAAPAGFEFVSKATAVDTNTTAVDKDKKITRPLNMYIHGGNFSNVNLDAVRAVQFALKTNQTMNLNNQFNDVSHDWLTFTLTQESDDMWNLVVTDVAGNTVYSSATDKTVAGGLLNGARNDKSNYVDNALNTILFGNPNGFKPFGDLYRDLDVYVTELRVKPKAFEGNILENALYNSRLATVTASEEPAPAGYTQVWAHTDETDNNHIRGDKYSSVPLDNVKQVSFAIKTPGNFTFDYNKENAGADYSGKDWIYFTLTQSESDIYAWNVLAVDKNYKPLCNTTARGDKAKNVNNYAKNSLQAILYGGDKVFVPLKTAEETITVYCTEIRGVMKDVALKGASIKDGGYETVFRESGIVTSVTETDKYVAAEGFEKVYEAKTDGNGTIHMGVSGNKTPLAAYEKVYLAMRNDNVYCIRPSVNADKDSSIYKGWIYIELTNMGLASTGATTWNVVVTTNTGKVIANYENVVTKSVDNYVQDALNAILYQGNWEVSPTGSCFGAVYVSEIRGTKKA